MNRTRSKKIIPVADLTELLKPYQSGWVALSEDERTVVGAGKTLSDAREEASRHSVSNPVFIKIIPPNQGYLPAFR